MRQTERERESVCVCCTKESKVINNFFMSFLSLIRRVGTRPVRSSIGRAVGRGVWVSSPGRCFSVGGGGDGDVGSYGACWSCGAPLTGMFFCGSCEKVQDATEGTSPYEVFGLAKTFSVDLKDAERRYWGLQKQLHPDKFALTEEVEQEYAGRQSTLVNECYETLKHPVLRGKFLLEEHGVEPLGESVGTGDVPMELLMLVMEIREEVEHLSPGDKAAASRILEKANGMMDLCGEEFASAMEGGETPDLDAASSSLVRLQYLRKIVDEVHAKSEEILM